MFQVIDGLRDFIGLLLWAKVVLLTPQPIAIHGSHEVKLTGPITAVTRGASLQVDVTAMLSDVSRNPVGAIKKAQESLPSGSIVATLVSAGGVAVELDTMSYMASNDRVWVTIGASGGIPRGVSFVRVIVRSRLPLTGVTVAWRNHQK